ncbi:MAG: GNAT family N-acetyltransferase [Caldilineaceae bacterium]
MQEQWVAEGITYGLVAANIVELQRRLNSYTLVAEVDGQIVGFVLATAQVSPGLAVIPAGERYLEIDDLYVIPAMRSTGIGGELLQAVEAAAQQAGIKRFLLYSATKDLAAVMNFYDKHGFRPWAVQMYK